MSLKDISTPILFDNVVPPDTCKFKLIGRKCVLDMLLPGKMSATKQSVVDEMNRLSTRIMFGLLQWEQELKKTVNMTVGNTHIFRPNE